MAPLSGVTRYCNTKHSVFRTLALMLSKYRLVGPTELDTVLLNSCRPILPISRRGLAGRVLSVVGGRQVWLAGGAAVKVLS